MRKKVFSFVLVVLFVALGWTIYADTLHHGWHFDDLSYIVQNPDIRSIYDWKTIFTSLSAPAIRFIPMYTFALNYHFGQTNVTGYHIINILIHILNGLGVWWFMSLLCRTPNAAREFRKNEWNYLPFLVATIFLTHPVNIQAVTYICQRFVSLATMFYLLTLCTYLKGRLAASKKSLYFSFACISALCAMMSKQITMTLPIILFCLEFLFFQSWNVKHIFQKKNIWIFLIFFIGLLIVPSMYDFNAKLILSQHAPSGSFRGEHLHSHTYFFTQMRVIPTYMRLLIAPIHQNLLYDFTTSYSFWEWKVVGGFLLILGSVVFALKVGRTQPLLAFGILWFFITLSVESGVIVIRHVIFEHRCYLPSIGFILVMVYVLKRISVSTVRWVSLCLMIIAVFSFLTVERNKVWQNGITLWSDVVQKSPHKTRGLVNLGIAFAQRKEYDKALEAYDRALVVYPQSTLSYNNRGIIFLKQYQFEKAVAEFNQAIAINSTVAEFLSNRADAYRHLGQYTKALEDYNQALALKPNLEQTLSNRGVVLVKLNEREQALASFNRAIEINPYMLEAYLNRANLLGQLAQYNKAIEDYNFVLKYDPDKAEAYNNRGNAYRQLEHYEQALMDYHRAIALKPDYAEAYNNRGVIYKKMNQFDAALADYNQAVLLDPQYASAFSNRGNLFHQNRQKDRALADYSRAIELDPMMRTAYYNRALLYALSNQKELALQDAQQAYRLGFVPAKELIARLRK